MELSKSLNYACFLVPFYITSSHQNLFLTSGNVEYRDTFTQSVALAFNVKNLKLYVEAEVERKLNNESNKTKPLIRCKVTLLNIYLDTPSRIAVWGLMVVAEKKNMLDISTSLNSFNLQE